MTKLIWGVLSSLLLLFVVWLCVCYAQYGNDFLTKHLDLVSTFNKMFNVTPPNTNLFQENIKTFANGFGKVGTYVNQLNAFITEDWGAFEWLKAIFTGVVYLSQGIYYLYNFVNFIFLLLTSLVNYIQYACNVLVNIIFTLFNPVFIGPGVVNE